MPGRAGEWAMAQRTVGIIINGATGRMGGIHLKGLLDIRAEGGLPLKGGDRLVPDPLLGGRTADTVKALADANGGLPWTTNLRPAIAGADRDFHAIPSPPGPPGCVSRRCATGCI